jgi:hypothetical protein
VDVLEPHTLDLLLKHTLWGTGTAAAVTMSSHGVAYCVWHLVCEHAELAMQEPVSVGGSYLAEELVSASHDSITCHPAPR